MPASFPLIVIAGPTASGKSSLAVSVAKKLNTEIISCDSRQIYKHMNIGTAKASKNERGGINHWLLDIVSPDAEYTVSNYKTDCDKAIMEIAGKNKIPVICGGTGFYLNAVLYDMNLGGVSSDKNIRNELEKKGKDDLYNELQKIDPETAKLLFPNDTVRVKRAIEIFLTTGKKKSEIKEDYKNKPRYKHIYVVLESGREYLYDRINKRVDIMLAGGLVGEVKQLVSMGYGKAKPLETIGYKEIISYLNDEFTLTEAADKIKQSTRNYAKRQVTWFKYVKDAVFINCETDIETQAREVIKLLNV